MEPGNRTEPASSSAHTTISNPVRHVMRRPQVTLSLPEAKAIAWTRCTGDDISDHREKVRLERFVTAWHKFDYKASGFPHRRGQGDSSGHEAVLQPARGVTDPAGVDRAGARLGVAQERQEA